METDKVSLKLIPGRDKFSKVKKALSFKTASKLLIYFVLICISFVYLEPIFKMISYTFMSSEDIIDPAVSWLPRAASVSNLKIAAGALKLTKTLPNSIGFSSLLAVCQTIVSALTGYALSRYNFKFKKFWVVMILLSFIIPVTLLMIPRLIIFMTMQDVLGISMIGTPVPQVLMAAMGQGVYSTVLILIFQNFFNLIPYSLDEAAMIDGASPMQVFIQIVLKISGSTLFVVFLFSLVWNWNETYITNTLVRGSIELLPAKLNSFDSAFSTYASSSRGSSESKINEAYKMAATLISISPMLVLYAFVQKKFIQGIENTGITGE